VIWIAKSFLCRLRDQLRSIEGLGNRPPIPNDPGLQLSACHSHEGGLARALGDQLRQPLLDGMALGSVLIAKDNERRIW
jgi:hypothetical protein